MTSNRWVRCSNSRCGQQVRRTDDSAHIYSGRRAPAARGPSQRIRGLLASGQTNASQARDGVRARPKTHSLRMRQYATNGTPPSDFICYCLVRRPGFPFFVFFTLDRFTPCMMQRPWFDRIWDGVFFVRWANQLVGRRHADVEPRFQPVVC